MDTRLEYFLAVAKSGSFTAAAQAVGVTQSAVTKSIADLERQFGHSLFHRTSRGALLTESGRAFAERAARIVLETRELLNGAALKGDEYAGVLRVGVCPASLEWCLADALVDLLTRHPSIRFEISGASFERMVQQVRNGGVDVALGFDAAFREWPDLRRAPMASLQATMFVRRGHPVLTGGPASLADLAQYDFVSPSDSQPYGAVIRGIYEGHAAAWQKRVHIIDYFPIVKRIVSSSDAIGVVALSHAITPAFREEFIMLDNLNPFPPSPLCCAVLARWEPRLAVRAFIAALRQTLATVATAEEVEMSWIPIRQSA